MVRLENSNALEVQLDGEADLRTDMVEYVTDS